MQILVTMPDNPARRSFFPLEVRRELAGLGNVEWNDTGREFSADELAARIRGIDVCMTGWGTARIDGEVVARADRLKLVAHTGGSVAPIVSDALFDRKVRVLSGNLLYAESVAEGVICYALAALRDLPRYTGELKAGTWRGADFSNEGLLDQRFGMVGFGMVARHLVRLLKPFRVRLLVYVPHLSTAEASQLGVETVGLREVFSMSRIVSLQLARRPQTRHLVDGSLLALMPDNSVLINTARGSIVDEEALHRELTTGRIRAVLDVYEHEPLPPHSPFLSLPNVICMPHMAGPTVDRRGHITAELVRDIGRFFSGSKPVYEITREYSNYMTE